MNMRPERENFTRSVRLFAVKANRLRRVEFDLVCFPLPVRCEMLQSRGRTFHFDCPVFCRTKVMVRFLNLLNTKMATSARELSKSEQMFVIPDGVTSAREPFLYCRTPDFNKRIADRVAEDVLSTSAQQYGENDRLW
jgi:hypothetical protein